MRIRWHVGLVTIAATAAISVGSDVATLRIDPSHAAHSLGRTLTGVCLEDVNHEIYGGLYSQLIFGESFAEPAVDGVSGMWIGFTRGNARLSVDPVDPFVGSQSQQLTVIDAGEAVIENGGLNHQGLGLLPTGPYEGHLWARADSKTTLAVSLTGGPKQHGFVTQNISVAGTQWRRYDFSLTPKTRDADARFEIRLSTPGSVHVGYVFLQPGPWGRFHDLPVRRDVAETLVDQGVTVIRYGGSMVNEPEYRWKNMIGDRDHRRPYRGHWYPQSSNGWGVVDFLNFAEAMNVMPVVDLNVDETPSDMADFLEYVNGPPDSPWGRRRAADGHPAPYHLTHLELGNEERVDETYAHKFRALAGVIWAQDPHLILTVGDFEYSKPIVDPMHITGATSGITGLAAQQQILAIARGYDAEVWFDVHVWTDAPPPSNPLSALPSYVDAIDALAGGAKHHVVVYELNANNHAQQRALANAQAMLAIERDGRLPAVASANALQVDGQNTNGWDQGLLFTTPGQCWLQPPGYAWQMFARHRGDRVIPCALDGAASSPLQAVATSDADQKQVVVQVVNPGDSPIAAKVELVGSPSQTFTPTDAAQLAGDLSATNTATAPGRVIPQKIEPTSNGQVRPFAPHSLTMLTFGRS